MIKFLLEVHTAPEPNNQNEIKEGREEMTKTKQEEMKIMLAIASFQFILFFLCVATTGPAKRAFIKEE